ncbi:hypothetical protein COOONC_06534 [Cooperia oncophora]
MVSAKGHSMGDLNLQVDWKNLQSGLEQTTVTPTAPHGSQQPVGLGIVHFAQHAKTVSLLPPLANSDHASVRFELLEGFSDAALLPTPDFLKVNYDRLNEYLSNVDWLGLFNNYVSMDDIYWRFCKTIYKALALFVPLKVSSASQHQVPVATYRNIAALSERTLIFRILYFLELPSIQEKVTYPNLDNPSLGNQASLKRLHQYVRCKFKSKTPLPTLKDLCGSTLFSEPSKGSSTWCYLQERSMTVRVGTSFSSRYPCTSGVPQGGVLSPLLFLIYTVELPQLLKTCPDIRVQIYADDIKVYCAYETEGRDVMYHALKLSVERMCEWSTSWGISY